jgi:hypothetical protein
MTWQRGISDAGAANLKSCDKLESVDLMGSPAGDGSISALGGKPRLRCLSTGNDLNMRSMHENIREGKNPSQDTAPAGIASELGV